jgi:protein-S-isoprenylcysteine O-methyltransferase Ste14
MIGTAIARREPRGFVSVVLLWLGFLIKSHMEEKFMRKTFGPEYEDYSKSTGALVPRLRM